MAEMITCPVCGAQNPANQKNCQRCQTTLVSDGLVQPGQAPIRKDTGELEPLLPQWLQDARQSAKENSENQQQTQQPAPEPAAKKPAASSTDFLAGLQSQARDDEDEEIPDWLASITGTPAPKQKASEAEEPSGVRWVETGNKNDFQQAEPDATEEDVPSWLTGMQQQSAPDEKDELTDWFRSSAEEPRVQQPTFEPQQQPPSFDAHSSNDTPDWLKQMAANAGEKEPEPTSDDSFGSSDWFSQPADSNSASHIDPLAQSSDTPDWLRQMQEDSNSSANEQSSASPFGSSSSSDSDLPGWLNQMQSGSMPAEPAQPVEPLNASSETPDWLNEMRSSGASMEPESAQAAEPFSFSSETPDWLSQLPTDNSASQQPATDPFSASSSSDMPDWLNGLGAVPGEESSPFVASTPAESEPFSSGSDMPSWLAPEQEASKKTDSKPRWLQSEEESVAGTPAWLASNDKTLVPEPDQSADEMPVNDVFSDMPDWLKSAAPASTIFDDPAPAVETPKAEAPKQQPSTPFEGTPAFSEDAFPSQGDALFTEMPDWLSNAMEEPASVGMVPEPIKGGDALAPDILPSWVEAMRPSDQGMSNIVNAANDATLESRGALAGLSGVLPLGTGFAPTSKPKAYSIKLNASDEQLKHATILEQILAAETSAVSLSSESTLGSSRVLRWSIALVLFIVTLLTSFLGTKIFATPQAQPNELKLAVAVSQAIPDNAPVLVAVDYEASRAGEIEAAAAPLFDNMLLLKHPRLTFVSSNESGAILAERLMNGPLAFHVQNGVSYLNLGYLPGGQMGIRAFAQDPVNVAPSDVNGQPAWTSPVVQDVTSLSQFALIILLTDDADAARSWVEQTENSRGSVPILVVSSAQSTPMIQPYYESGQVAGGIVSGLYGGAIFEQQYNNGRPGLARNYWDAYSIGMLLAMLLLVVGGLVNLALGMRDSTVMREGK